MTPTEQTLALFKEALANADPAILAKAGWVQPSTAITGLQGYMLDQTVKELVPYPTPLVSSIPRVNGGYTIQANWRAVTGVNTGNVPATVAEGKRGGIVTTSTAEYLAAFRGIGLEDNVTWEAQYAGKNFEDIRAGAARRLLMTTRLAEEKLVLGGQGTFALGTTPTPSGVLTAGGAMTAQATVAFCIALTLDGYKRATVAGGVVDQVTVTAAGPYGGTTTINAGHAIVSGQSGAITTAGGNLSVTWTVAAVPGAFAYAWYTGLSGAANCSLTAITTTNKFVQTADAAGTQKANFSGSGSDRSQNSLAFDGLIALCVKSGSNGYYKSYDGAAAHYDNKGGATEIDTALAAFYGTAASGNLNISPTDLWLASADMNNFGANIFGGSASIARINIPADGSIEVGGQIPTVYVNKITGTKIRIHLHPDLPSGKALFTTNELPYPVNNVGEVFQVLCRQEYMAYDWPMTARQYEFGVYADEVLQHFFPPSLGIIDNIVW